MTIFLSFREILTNSGSVWFQILAVILWRDSTKAVKAGALNSLDWTASLTFFTFGVTPFEDIVYSWPPSLIKAKMFIFTVFWQKDKIVY